MKVLFVASEALPFMASGGLGLQPLTSEKDTAFHCSQRKSQFLGNFPIFKS